MYSDKESYLWYVKLLSNPNWYKELPKELIYAGKCYLVLYSHMQYINDKYKK